MLQIVKVQIQNLRAVKFSVESDVWFPSYDKLYCSGSNRWKQTRRGVPFWKKVSGVHPCLFVKKLFFTHKNFSLLKKKSTHFIRFFHEKSKKNLVSQIIFGNFTFFLESQNVLGNYFFLKSRFFLKSPFFSFIFWSQFFFFITHFFEKST